ncbi:MAG TPA: GNAT family N-acetyltransferase [Candidatus Polarisedimenticolia bacterium]|nr:GNAT family N-acetyltransferase [Candidatus Polarisedimenticolia bacterium]
MRIRESHRDDRRSLENLGHPTDAIETLCPTYFTRLAWAIRGTTVRSFLLENPASGTVVGSVQFVRSRIDRRTWMFGHWRVSSEQRGRGAGGALLRGALARIAGAARLYSLIEAHNERSIRAHERLGFERSSNHCGGGPLGFLSTVGPPAPSVRLLPATAADLPELFALYQRSMGSLWGRLFPGLAAPRFLHAADEPPDPAHPGHPAATIPERVMLVSDADEHTAFVVRSRRRTSLFCDPERCDAGLVARVANRLLALGAGRDEWLALRGLPEHLGPRSGPIRCWLVMGTTDPGGLRDGS